MPPAEYWFDSHDGLRLFSRVYAAPCASAPVVLCLHGLTRNSRDFEELATHLSARCRVIVPDIRGRGFSARDPDANNYQIPIYLGDTLLLLAGLGAQRVTVIGTSMGGLMAMVLAVMQPQLVARIVLNDIGPEVDPAGLERIRSYAGKDAPVRSWGEAIAQVRNTYATVWPDLGEERWEKIARLSYRIGAQGVPEVDADLRIGRPGAQVPELRAGPVAVVGRTRQGADAGDPRRAVGHPQRCDACAHAAREAGSRGAHRREPRPPAPAR